MVKIIGLTAHVSRLKRLAGPAMVEEIGKAVFATADELVKDAQISISAGSVSGKGHVPSAPGHPPNYDTGHLSDNIVSRKTGPLTAEAASEAEYAAYLEFGTSRMAPRPYMAPAAEKTRPKMSELIVEAVKRVSRP